MPTREKAVVARLASGLVLRGSTVDFNPDRPTLWIDPDGGGRGVEVKLRDLKALFFPYPAGQTRRTAPPPRGNAPDPVRDGKRVVARFQDGETMTGHTLACRSDRIGFFLTPDDPDSQHERIFVVLAATTEVLLGRDAENHPIVVRVAPNGQDKAA
jgi:hypothetical protein